MAVRRFAPMLVVAVYALFAVTAGAGPALLSVVIVALVVAGVVYALDIAHHYPHLRRRRH